MMTELTYMAEAVRRAHCDRFGTAHECAGTCTISRDGIALECPLCGKGENWIIDEQSKTVQRARRLLDACGISWGLLSTDALSAFVRELERQEKEATQ